MTDWLREGGWRCPLLGTIEIAPGITKGARVTRDGSSKGAEDAYGEAVGMATGTYGRGNKLEESLIKTIAMALL